MKFRIDPNPDETGVITSTFAFATYSARSADFVLLPLCTNGKIIRETIAVSLADGTIIPANRRRTFVGEVRSCPITPITPPDPGHAAGAPRRRSPRDEPSVSNCLNPCQGCTTTCVNLGTAQRDRRQDQTPSHGTSRPIEVLSVAVSPATPKRKG